MPIVLAKKLEELDFSELLDVLQKLEMEDREAFKLLEELVEDI